MFHWIETHGIEVLAGYYLLISILGTMPPLPENASYWQKWGFAAAHAFCGNVQRLVESMRNGKKEL